ncbi:MAG: hypothetical protein ACXVIC_01925 [Halobacteriota archaeon]
MSAYHGASRRSGMRASAAKRAFPATANMRFELYNEGVSVQIMRVGPYADEDLTIEKLHAFIERSGYKRRGKH